METEKLKNENAALRAKLGRTLLRQRLVDEAVRRGLGTHASKAADLALLGHKGETDDEGNAASAGGTPIAPKELFDTAAKSLPEVFARMRALGGAPSGGEAAPAAGPDTGDGLDGLSSSQLLARGLSAQIKASIAAVPDGRE